MKEKLLFLAILATPVVGHAWCNSNGDCPTGYYCSKHSVYVGNYCERIPVSPHSAKEYFTLPENKPLNMPFSEAVRVGNTVYLAGQIGIPPGDTNVVPGGIGPESEQTLTNIGLVLKHFNLTFENVVRCQAMLADIAEWPAFNVVYRKYFKSPYPARSAFAASGLAFNARVELECIAVIPGSHSQ